MPSSRAITGFASDLKVNQQKYRTTRTMSHTHTHTQRDKKITEVNSQLIRDESREIGQSKE